MTHAHAHKSGRSEEEINTTCLQKLGINTAELEGAGDPVDGQHVGRNAVIHFVNSSKTHHFIEGIVHHVEEALVHFALPPEEALAILDPFEIADEIGRASCRERAEISVRAGAVNKQKHEQ